MPPAPAAKKPIEMNASPITKVTANWRNPEIDEAVLGDLDKENISLKEKAEITATDLLNRKVESIPCLIEPFFQQVGLAAIVGSSDTGKSSFLRQLAFDIATGAPDFLGYKTNAKHRSVIYVSSEDDEAATAYFLHSLNKSKGVLTERCNGLRFVFDTHNLLAELDKRLTNKPADLVIIDAFGDLYSGDANKTNQIRQFLHDFSQLAQKHECLILWLHHTGKRTDEGAPSKHNVIGGQGFEGKMRLVAELRRDYHDPTLRHLCFVKGNYLPDDQKTDSHVLEFENFLFTNTGRRVPFEQLAKPQDDSSESDKDKYLRAKKMKEEDKTLAQIAAELGYSDASGAKKLLDRGAKKYEANTTK